MTDAERAKSSDRRPTDGERREAAALLQLAQREGRFGVSDLYELRLEAISSARSTRDLAAQVSDLDALVPEAVRARVLELLCAARGDGRLSMEDFDDRTSRCLGPLEVAAADAVVADLGHRVVREEGIAAPGLGARFASRLGRSRAWLVGPSALAGAAAGVVVVAVPAALSVPGGAGQWLPLALGCGCFGAVAAAISTLAWRVRVGRGLRGQSPLSPLGLSAVGDEPRGDGRGTGSGRAPCG